MGDFSIQITADLVNQLAGENETLKKKKKRTKPKIPRKPPRLQTNASEKKLHDDSEAHKRTLSGLPVQPPFFLPVAPPVQSANKELDAIRAVVQESERVLEKLQKQEDDMVREVTERAKDLREKEFKLPYQKPMPCLDAYDACQACYKKHGNDILKCAPLTRSYYDCVRRLKQAADK